MRYILHYGHIGLNLIKFFGVICSHKHILALISGGSLFLFDRKVLRYFRKDGHNWRKKKDGKTVKEAHERLKVSILGILSIDISTDLEYEAEKFNSCIFGLMPLSSS